MKRYFICFCLFFLLFMGFRVYAYDDSYFEQAPNGFLCGERENSSLAISMADIDPNGASVSLRVIHVPFKVTRNSDGNYFMWSDISFIKYQGRVGYCIDPLTKITTSANYNSLDYSKVLTKEKRDVIEKIMFYGYSYPGHQSDDYYLATQKLIWESLDFSVKYYAKNSNFTGNYSVSDEVKEINRLIQDHDKKISFDGKNIHLKVGESITLIDETNILNDFVLEDVGDGLVVEKVDNQLRLLAVSTCVYSVQLRKGAAKLDDVYVLAHKGSSSQTIVTIEEGALEPVRASFLVSVSGVGNLDLWKVDSVSGQGIGGVKFLISKDASFEDAFEVSSGEDGHIVVNDLEVGTYYYQEIETIEPYILDDEIKTFEIKENETTYITCENQKQKFELLIEKQDVDTKEIAQAEASLDDAEYLVLADDKTTVIERVLALGTVAKVKTLLDVNTTYYIQEVVAPKGMELNTELIEVYVPYQSNQQHLTHQVVCYDKVISNTITIQKYVHTYEFEQPQKQIGENFIFNIYDYQNQCVDTLITNTEGMATSKELPYGTYTIKEETHVGYHTLDPFTVTIDSSTKDYFYTLVNEPIDYDFVIRKVNENNQPLENVEFTIALDANMQQIVGKKKTNQEGELVFTHLLPKTYYVQETKTVTGYVIDSTIYAIQVPEMEELEVMNTLKEVVIRIQKIDEKHQPLANAKFKLVDEYGLVQYATSNSEGIAEFVVHYGSYTLEEILAPTGYVLLDQVITIEINETTEENGVYTLELMNLPHDVVDTADTSRFPLFAFGFSIIGVILFVCLRMYS